MVGVAQKYITYEKPSDEYLIAALSDFHIGNGGVDKDLLERTVKWCWPVRRRCHPGR